MSMDTSRKVIIKECPVQEVVRCIKNCILRGGNNFQTLGGRKVDALFPLIGLVEIRQTAHQRSQNQNTGQNGFPTDFRQKKAKNQVNDCGERIKISNEKKRANGM